MLFATLVGNLGRDAAVKQLPNGGRSVIEFNVASTEKSKDTENTTWVKCSYFVQTTTVAQYLKKGTQVCVVGRMQLRTYQKNDGSTGNSLELIVSELKLIGGKAGAEANDNRQQPAQQNGGQQTYANTEPMDDLPF